MILTPDFAHIFPWKKMGSFIQSIAGHGLHRFHRFYRSTSTTIWKLPQNFFHNGYLGSGFVDLVLQRQQKNGIWSVVHGNPSFAWRIFPKKTSIDRGDFPSRWLILRMYLWSVHRLRAIFVLLPMGHSFGHQPVSDKRMWLYWWLQILPVVPHLRRWRKFQTRKPIGEVGCCESWMADRNHWWIFLSVYLTIYLSTFVSS